MPSAATSAEFTNSPVAVAVATIVTLVRPPRRSVPSAQRTRWPSTAHVPCSGVILPISSPAGTGSVSVAFCAASGPLLCMASR